MPRKQSGRGPGRPRLAHAKRRCTTREGRRTGRDAVDRGTDELLARKRRATTREDLPVDGPSVLFGRGLIDREQFDVLGTITRFLQRVSRSWGGKDGSVGGLWLNLLSAATAVRGGRALVVPLGADRARLQLPQILAQLDGSHTLIVALVDGHISPLIAHILEHRPFTAEDERNLAKLRYGLDAIAPRRTRDLVQAHKS